MAKFGDTVILCAFLRDSRPVKVRLIEYIDSRFPHEGVRVEDEDGRKFPISWQVLKRNGIESIEPATGQRTLASVIQC